MSDHDRHRQIADYLREQPFASVRDLQRHLGVSAATIRRDIDKLHSVGMARKVYGGISAAEAKGLGRMPAASYDENRDIAVEAKRAIAARAETMVRDGDCVIVHAGSTCFELGVRLARRAVGLHTNSMPLAAALGTSGTCHLTLAGGTLYREPGIVHDPVAGPPDIFASRFFLGAQGIGPEGILESHPVIVKAVGELAVCADEIVLLADSRKFRLHPRNVALPLARVSTLVTDEGLRDADARMVEAAGIAIVTVPVPMPMPMPAGDAS